MQVERRWLKEKMRAYLGINLHLCSTGKLVRVCRHPFFEKPSTQNETVQGQKAARGRCAVCIWMAPVLDSDPTGLARGRRSGPQWKDLYWGLTVHLSQNQELWSFISEIPDEEEEEETA